MTFHYRLSDFISGFPLFYATLVKKEFIYKADISGWLFVMAGTGVILIVLFTVAYQSVHAARANPITNLRNE